MGVGQDQKDGRDDGDDPSQRQPIEPGGELHDKDLPQQIAERRRLVEGPLLHSCLNIAPVPASVRPGKFSSDV